MTKDAYFSLLTRTKQLLLVTFCDLLAGIEVSFWADGTGWPDGRANGWTDGWTDKRRSRNSYLDVILMQKKFFLRLIIGNVKARLGSLKSRLGGNTSFPNLGIHLASFSDV